MDYQCRGKQKFSLRLRLGREYHEKSSKLDRIPAIIGAVIKWSNSDAKLTRKSTCQYFFIKFDWAKAAFETIRRPTKLSRAGQRVRHTRRSAQPTDTLYARFYFNSSVEWQVVHRISSTRTIQILNGHRREWYRKNQFNSRSFSQGMSDPPPVSNWSGYSATIQRWRS